MRGRKEGLDGEPPLSPVATGVALGIWVGVMLVLAFIVVPTLFASCFGRVPPA